VWRRIDIPAFVSLHGRGLYSAQGGAFFVQMKQTYKRVPIGKVAAPAVALAARHFVGNGKPLDFKLGTALFRDRRVAVPYKMAALAAGFVAMIALNAVELPAETLLAVMLPVIGVGLDIAFNSFEWIVGPLLMAAFALPHIAPKELVSRLREERDAS